MKKILINASIIAIAAIAVIGATVSYFSDTEASSGNQFIADTLGLQVGSLDPTTWNFARENILPGDSGKEGVALYNNENMDGDLNISFANLSDEENVCWEPEYADEPDCGNDNLGELGKYMDILAYLDENNNGNYDPAVDTFVYQGKANGILGGGLSVYFLPSGATKYFMLEWNLDSSVLNMAQSDKIGFDIVFDLNQTNNPGPTSICGNGAIEGTEQCDDGGSNGTACSPIYGGNCNYCSISCQTIILTGGFCDDGIINGTEACDDDGNNGIFGYCNSDCTGQTASVCGNGVKEGTEQCDDGNTTSGDGCSSVCQDEPMLTIGSQSASYGNNITVPIIATNAFSNVGSVTLYIDRAPGLLTYTGYTLDKLPSSAVNQIGDEIRIVWYDSTGTNPISFNSGDVLMYLNFNVSASPGTANLIFDPASMVGDSSGSEIPTVFANGVITIN